MRSSPGLYGVVMNLLSPPGGDEANNYQLITQLFSLVKTKPFSRPSQCGSAKVKFVSRISGACVRPRNAEKERPRRAFSKLCTVAVHVGHMSYALQGGPSLYSDSAERPRKIVALLRTIP